MQTPSFLQQFHSMSHLPATLSKHKLEYVLTTPSHCDITRLFVLPPSVLSPPANPELAEIVVSLTKLYAVYSNGFAAVFDKFSAEYLCEVSAYPSTRVKTIYYNRVNATVIVISMTAEDDFNSLQCAYYTEEALLMPDSKSRAVQLFGNERICSPGFIEFDENNRKILTKSKLPPNYKVWSMESYKLEIHVVHPAIEEIRFSLGYLLFLYRPHNNQLLIDVYDVSRLAKVSAITIDLLPGVGFEFIELFNENLLIKHKNKCIFMINLRNRAIARVWDSEQFSPEAFIFLSEAHVFMTLQGSKFRLWTVTHNTLSALPGFDVRLPAKAKVSPELIFLSKDQGRLYVYTKSCAKPYPPLAPQLDREHERKKAKKENIDPRRDQLLTLSGPHQDFSTPRKPPPRRPMTTASNLPDADIDSAGKKPLLPEKEEEKTAAATKKNYAAYREEERRARMKGCMRVFPIVNCDEEACMIKGYYRVNVDRFNRERMNKITTLIYDDFHHDIYLGNQEGVILKWQAKLI